MVDPDLRKSLSQDMRRLITGRMSNDDFDDVYYEHYESSEDRAVREIAGMCYSLYSSDLLFPYRLRGRHAVDAEIRGTAARAVLFLRSGREYEWPDFPDNPGFRLLAGLAMFLGIPAGIALLLTSLVATLAGSFDIAGLFAILGFLLLSGSLFFAFGWPTTLQSEWESFRASGDYDVWPFLRRDDFDNARQNCHLLGNVGGHAA